MVYNSQALELVCYYLKYQNEFMGDVKSHKFINLFISHVDTVNVEDTIIGIDVGACVGSFFNTLRLICNETNSSYLLFEPNPLSFNYLNNNIKNSNTLIENIGISIEDTIDILRDNNLNEDNKNYIGYEVGSLRGNGNKICDINVKRLDTILKEKYGTNNIIIKLLKIDTEGNDTNVIKSLGKYINVTKYIIFECSDCLLDKRGPGIDQPIKDIIDFLDYNDFDTYRIGSERLIKMNNEYWHDVYNNISFCSDCFAIRKNDSLIHKIIDNTFYYN